MADSLSKPLEGYLQEIEKALKRGDATEHTHRPALKNLIELVKPGITATNEPKRIECGAPDYIVTKGQVPLGYVEAKDVGENLDGIEKTDQLDRYRNGLTNLILTDYLEFRWYVTGEHRLTARLATADAKGTLRPHAEGAESVSELLSAFLAVQAPTVRSPRELAARMAGLARLIRESIRQTFVAEDKSGTLHLQLEGFRKVLIGDLNEEQFADMYAQTICYGLFAARCNHSGPERFSREQAAFELPRTNPFLRQMFGYIAGPELDERVTWAVDDLADLLDRAAIETILKDFGRRTRQEDPVVHFYETFLAEYDPTMREACGVYYTPEPVVSYIVRSVDHLLKTKFDLADGLAEISTVVIPGPEGTGEVEAPKVIILDPAVGTGTFLYGVIDQIYEHEIEKGQKGAWSGYVSRYLLPRLFGFELLMAPYAVCHMKLGLQLAETGYDFKANERLRVYLTNTLEEAHKLGDLPLFARELAREAYEAGEVKQTSPVMVILGNPPYSGHSANKGKWISGLLRGKDTLVDEKTANYFEVDGKPLGERNPKWLNDDYVKFIRFAQWRIEQTGYGVLAFISNHSYLDAPTFRGMRQTLMEIFDDIYVLDLHGSSKKKERAPDGSKDENVFDIQQGVAIGIFVKRGEKKKGPARVSHADLWGAREIYEAGEQGEKKLTGGKYHWLWANDITGTQWETLAPQSPNYLFKPQDTKLLGEYDMGWKLTEMLPTHSVGVVTARDKLTIHFSPEDVRKTVQNFVSLSPEEARSKYNLGKDVRDWKVSLAQEDLRRHSNQDECVVDLLYRPFDRRFTYYTGQTRGFICMPRPEVMSHMLAGNNVALSTTRSIEIGRGWEHIFCSRTLIQHHTVSVKEVNHLFPLYTYSHELAPDVDISHGRRANLAPAFVKDFSTRLGMTFVADGRGDCRKTVGPEDLFHYMYVVLHSPTYRERYAEFLKMDFPRLPLTSNADLFRALCGLGEELVALHLMETFGPSITGYPVVGDGVVDKVRYTEPAGDTPGRVWINGSQYFEGVPPEVWNFHVGGYQVCAKWLKDRKGRKLGYDDIQHYQHIVSALSETIRLMGEVDKAIDSDGGWPIQKDG